MSKEKKKDDGRVFCDDGSVLIKDNSEASKKIDELLKMEDKGGEMNNCEYTHREDIILNWIEYFTSDDKELMMLMRINLQHYLQQEIWKGE